MFISTSTLTFSTAGNQSVNPPVLMIKQTGYLLRVCKFVAALFMSLYLHNSGIGIIITIYIHGIIVTPKKKKKREINK